MAESIPSAAKWAIRFEDDSADKLSVSYDLKANHFADCVEIKQYESREWELQIEHGDLRWLAARLIDAADAIEALTPTPPEPLS
jgi:hypothetical protein